jgi:hypothetical protein
MKHFLRYAYYDLGDQPEGRDVLVRLSDSRANVILVDHENFYRYRMGGRFFYRGGLARSRSVKLTIPCEGHWYLVLDLAGRPGRVRGTVKVVERSAAAA